MSEQTANLCTTDAAESLRAVVAERDREIERLKEGQSILILARDEQKRLANEYRDLWSRAAVKAQPSGVVLDRQEAVNALYHYISGPGDCYAAARRVFDAGYRLNSSSVSAGDDRETIRAVFLRNGFTIKEGQADLKPYVYAAADELMSIARAALSAPSHGEQVPATIGGTEYRYREALKHLREVLDPEDWMGEISMHAFIDAALSAPSHGEQVRDGWKLVPVEPTPEMISAASGAITKPDDLPPVGVGGWSMSDLAFRSRYRAAIAAAPSAGSQEQGE